MTIAARTRGALISVLAPIAALSALAGPPAYSGQVAGRAYEDRDADGVRGPSDPPLPGVSIRLAGTASGGGGLDITTISAADGTFGFSPTDGCYLLAPVDPPGWRRTGTRRESVPSSTPGYTFPVGRSRLSGLDQAIGHLATGSFRLAAMGDSIARNFNLCSFPPAFWYNTQVLSRLACTTPGVATTLDQAAVLGEHTDDLLVDDGASDGNNVFRAIQNQPDMITLSMIGNDLLGVDPGGSPTQAQINRAVAEILDSRENLQEALSSLVTGVPGADIVINTLYDNEAWNCQTGAPGPFHRAWLPIVNRILRDLAWGQARRLSIAEAAAEMAHEDQAGQCLGFTGMICRDLFGLDRIHPTQNGYTILREKLWEASGGVTLGAGDALGRTSLTGADVGYLRRVARLLPTRWETRSGGSVETPEGALDDADGGAHARIALGAGAEEFRLTGFPDWLDEIRIVRAIAGVRYRTSGTVGDDPYRIEASPTGQFRPPPGFAYTTTNWNVYTPIVGGGGPNRPPENPDYPAARTLALPDVATWREVSATLSKNPVLPAGAADYDWPALTHQDLATAAIRVVSAPVAATPGNDDYRVELDAAWIDLYGWDVPRPAEVGGVAIDRLSDGTLQVTFDALPGAQRYNLYLGRVATLAGGTYDHGGSAPAGPLCDAPAADVGGGRMRITVGPSGVPAEDFYALVTAHVDDVESPSGAASAGGEIDRSQSTCR